MAFQRAIMGYEEAQASLASLAADLERAKEELASRKKRERMLSQRVEDLLEEMQAEKEKRVRDQESYAKEIKRCRKETYRAELAVVEARQDLQDTRADLKKSLVEMQHEKNEKDKSRQESFERAYALAGTVGELDQARDQLRVVEKERDAAMVEVKASAAEKIAMAEKAVQTESVGTQKVGPTTATIQEAQNDRSESVMAVRKAIQNQWAHHADSKSDVRPGSAHSVASGSRITSERPPRPHATKVPDLSSVLSRLNSFGKQSEGKMAPEEQIHFLKQELAWAKRKNTEDADLIHLMHMQCQFKACPCRLAESNGERFVHDAVYDAKMQQQRASKKRKIAREADEGRPEAQEIKPAMPEQHVPATHTPPRDTPKAYRIAPVVHETAILPPEPTPELRTRASESPLVLEQAVEIPLPEPEPTELDSSELDSSNTTPEGTAQLEEITQVLVDPATGSKTFAFSTSSMANLRTMPPPLRHTESASATFETDLFDLSPPKQPPPKRPSTAMGILNLESPMRLMPESPRSARSSRDSIRSSIRDRNHTITTSSVTTTTKIALKDSPPRLGLHRRAQSKPNLRSHSPLVTSTVMSHHDDSARPVFVKETSASPAANTVFPITPVHKHSRSMHNLAQHAQAQARQMQEETHIASPPQTMTTTTTRVPLRAAAEEDDVFSPDQPSHSSNYDHAQTEVLNVRIENIPPPIYTYPQSASRTSSTSSSAILANVPGTPITREAALAQIRARRDRARSVNLKKSLEGIGNAGKENAGGRSPSKGRPVVVNSGGLFGGLGKEIGLPGRGVREISQASAPGRIAF